MWVAKKQYVLHHCPLWIPKKKQKNFMKEASQWGILALGKVQRKKHLLQIIPSNTKKVAGFMKNNKAQQKKRRYLVVCFLLFVFGAGCYYTFACEKNPFTMGEKTDPQELEGMARKEKEKISVTISGAVKNGGTFSMEKGETVKDVLTLAGGFTQQADENRIPLMDVVFHEESIYVPAVGESVASCIGYQNDIAPKQRVETPNNENIKINLNQADEQILCSLPKIGVKRAQAILQYRQEHGRFDSIEEIEKVEGISTKIYEEIKGYLTIE